MLSLIVAHDEQRIIGKDGWMPWNLPQDLAHFKKTTLNHAILMGKTTFMGMGKPLPKRHTYVATRDLNFHYDHENVTIIHDLPAFFKEWQDKAETLYVCGGAMIYEQALPYVNELWISLVEGTHAGDTYFPYYDPKQYRIVSKEAKEGFVIIHYRKL